MLSEADDQVLAINSVQRMKIPAPGIIFIKLMAGAMTLNDTHHSSQADATVDDNRS